MGDSELALRLLLTGASGYLGSTLSRIALNDHSVISGYSSGEDRVRAGVPERLDLLAGTPELARILDRLQPEAIIHAASVNPGGPEALMRPVNVDGTRRLAELAAERGIRWVQVSTDVVHDGSAAPYSDDASPTPLGTYAQSKADGERAVLEVLPGATIVRTSLIYGLETMDRGTEGFAERLASGQPVKLFSDVIRQPVWVDALARALVKLAERNPGGFINVAGSQAISREAFARRMLEFWRVEGRERAQSVEARSLGLEIPYDLRLDLGRARQIFGDGALPGVDEVLEREGRRVGQKR